MLIPRNGNVRVIRYYGEKSEQVRTLDFSPRISNCNSDVCYFYSERNAVLELEVNVTLNAVLIGRIIELAFLDHRKEDNGNKVTENIVGIRYVHDWTRCRMRETKLDDISYST